MFWPFKKKTKKTEEDKKTEEKDKGLIEETKEKMPRHNISLTSSFSAESDDISNNFINNMLGFTQETHFKKLSEMMI